MGRLVKLGSVGGIWTSNFFSTNFVYSYLSNPNRPLSPPNNIYAYVILNYLTVHPNAVKFRSHFPQFWTQNQYLYTSTILLILTYPMDVDMSIFNTSIL